MLVKKIRNLWNDIDKPLLIVVLIMVIFGTLNIVTASSREAVVRYDASLYHYFFQHLKMLSIALVGSIIILHIDTNKYPFWVTIGFGVVLALLLYLLVAGQDHKGARNWLSIFGFSFQPSEFAKPIMIVGLAILFERFHRKLRRKTIPHYDMIGLILVVGILIPVIVFFQKDFGTMLIMLGTFGILFLASPILRKEKVKTILLLIVLVFIGGALMIYKKGYILSKEQMDRFDFLNPCTKYETGGYQICNGFIAINDGGLLGLGIGKSKQKYSYIPEPHTDSVFAIIAEENGFLRSTLIFIGYIFILKRIFDLSSRASTMRGRYMCLGIGVYIFMHILVNLGGLFGVLPLTGVPLPFFSYGGSFTITLLCSLAIVQRIHIETKNQKIKIRGVI